MTDERGGRGTSTGETVEVHDSEGDGEVNVIDDGLSASVRSIGEANAAEAETHLSEADGPGGEDGDEDEDAGVTAVLSREEAYQAIRKGPPNVARRVFLEVWE